MMYNVLTCTATGFLLNGYNGHVILNLYFFHFSDVLEDTSKNLEPDANGKSDGKPMADDGGCHVNKKLVELPKKNNYF